MIMRGAFLAANHREPQEELRGKKSHLHKHMLIFSEQGTVSGVCSQTPIRTVNCISASKAGTLILFAFI